jgi:hypothetical protein
MAAAAISSSTDNIVAHGAIILREREGIWGRLDSITESGDMILAEIGGQRIELPVVLMDILQPILGQSVVVGLFDGRHHAGRCGA